MIEPMRFSLHRDIVALFVCLLARLFARLFAYFALFSFSIRIFKLKKNHAVFSVNCTLDSVCYVLLERNFIGNYHDTPHSEKKM